VIVEELVLVVVVVLFLPVVLVLIAAVHVEALQIAYSP
jgi:hypothetical protein